MQNEAYKEEFNLMKSVFTKEKSYSFDFFCKFRVLAQSRTFDLRISGKS
jgi:hypothetical protein